jgi:raffinose/stachyose/melibiose transport system substrate-binding protein
MFRVFKIIWRFTGLIFLLVFFLWAAVWVFLVSRGGGVPDAADKTIVRLVHSVSDEGVQAAFDSAAAEYEKINPDVKVVIQSIPEKAYLQWTNVQLIGGKAPDIIQTLNRGDQMWEMLATRFFLPLTPHVNDINPHNKGTNLENTIWRDTYVDGMQGGYWFHLMEYYSVPLTIELSRIFYNKDLFRQVKGDDLPPENFQQWMDICRQIKDYSKENNLQLSPLATFYSPASLYGFFNSYFPVMTGGMIDEYDRGYNGIPDATFILFGLIKGDFTLANERFETALALLRELSENFQPGFASAQSSQSRFMFIQNKAAMIKGSVKDARIFQENCNFEVGVFDYPIPRRDHPVYGKYVAGPVAESPVGQFHFGVSKVSKNPELAIDFLRFLSSRRINEQFNQSLVWYPVISGARPHDFLKAFKPHYEGVYRYPHLWQGGDVKLWWDQFYPRYLVGDISFENFMKEYEKVWLTKGIRDFIRRDVLYENMLSQSEFGLAQARSKIIFPEAGELEKGSIVGEGTSYQLGMEVLNLMQHGISNRRYIWNKLQQQYNVVSDE